jgi:hypothetical protein
MSVIFFLLAIACREDIAIIVALLGLVYMFSKQSRKFGILVLAIGLLWIGFVLAVIYPSLSISGAISQADFYQKYGSSASEIATYFLAHPIKIVQQIFTLPFLSYLLLIFLPLGFMSLFSLRYLVPGIVLFCGIIFLPASKELELGVSHVHAPLVALIIIAAIYGLRTLRARSKNPELLTAKFLLFSLCVTVFFTLRTNIYFISFSESRALYPQEKITSAEKAIKLIPKDASIATSWKLGTKLSGRKNLYMLPTPQRTNVDYVIMSSQVEKPCSPTSNQETVFRCEGTATQYAGYISELEQSVNFEKIYNESGVLVFKKIKPE